MLQHAHNPVDWYPWGEEAFERARLENKPVLVSIGYAACHWCHVMERESFEDATVAAFMNEHFVNIKVDREERPDVDQVYMDAVTAISGSGGWPMNVFLTPQKLPFYGGTYFPPIPAYSRPSWSQVLYRMAEVWYEQNEVADKQAQQILGFLKQNAGVSLGYSKNEADVDTCKLIVADLLSRADTLNGGFGAAPKFPGTMAISFLLQHYYFTRDNKPYQHALLSLDKMAKGGIFDQLAGGFARYATDSAWLVPHFEKMLYDNALFISLFIDAYTITQNPFYKLIAEKTISFVCSELGEAEGGFYCAIDADSEGVEGKFYTWQWSELEAVLGSDVSLVTEWFGATKEGNWEHTNILHLPGGIKELAIRHQLDEVVVLEKLENAQNLLVACRSQRVRPITDDKCLLSWNALMNIALTKASAATRDGELLHRADSHMKWMLSKYVTGEQVYHNYKNGKHTIEANLEDFSFLVQAMIQLAAVGGNNNYIIKACSFIERILELFYDAGSGFFYFTSKSQTDLPVRKIDIQDGVMPSGNAMMAHNLLLCGIVMGKTDWIDIADNMLQKVATHVTRYSYSYGYWASIIQIKYYGILVVICTGINSFEQASQLNGFSFPNVLVLTCQKEISYIPLFENKYFQDKNSIFVCSRNACLPPVSTVNQAVKLIESQLAR